MTQAWERMKALIKPETASWALVILGVVMRLRAYLNNRSLWGDEASLAVNIVERSFMGLTQPLSHHQAAPLGFLFIEKLSITFLWNADYILRLFPLFAGLVSVWLIYLIARKNIGMWGMFALFMFAVNPQLVYYSSELKQYSSDVAVALLLVYLALRCFEEDAQNKDFIALGIAGVISIWISHISIFILAAIGITLAFETLRFRRSKLPQVFALGAAWLASFGLEYLVALQYTAADKYFQTFWGRRFVPLPPWSSADLWWFVKTGYFFLFTIIPQSDPLTVNIICGLLLVGFISFVIKNWHLALTVLLVFLVTMTASALGMYPLTYRFMLFLTPLALLLMAEGIARIYSWLATYHRGIALFVSAAPAALLIWHSTFNAILIFNHPQTMSEIRPIVKYVAEHKQLGDVVYVYYNAVPGFKYYAPFYGEFESKGVILGTYRQNEEKGLERFFEESEKLKGSDRVWVIFAEIVECGGCEEDKRLYFEDYFNQHGIMLDSIKDVDSAAYLYDLNP